MRYRLSDRSSPSQPGGKGKICLDLCRTISACAARLGAAVRQMRAGGCRASEKVVGVGGHIASRAARMLTEDLLLAGESARPFSFSVGATAFVVTQFIRRSHAICICKCEPRIQERNLEGRAIRQQLALMTLEPPPPNSRPSGRRDRALAGRSFVGPKVSPPASGLLWQRATQGRSIGARIFREQRAANARAELSSRLMMSNGL